MSDMCVCKSGVKSLPTPHHHHHHICWWSHSSFLDFLFTFIKINLSTITVYTKFTYADMFRVDCWNPLQTVSSTFQSSWQRHIKKKSKPLNFHRRCDILPMLNSQCQCKLTQFDCSECTVFLCSWDWASICDLIECRVMCLSLCSAGDPCTTPANPDLRSHQLSQISDVRAKDGSFAQGRKKHSSTLLITSGLNMLLYVCRLSGT